jgi:hypothetical protein
VELLRLKFVTGIFNDISQHAQQANPVAGTDKRFISTYSNHQRERNVFNTSDTHHPFTFVQAFPPSTTRRSLLYCMNSCEAAVGVSCGGFERPVLADDRLGKEPKGDQQRMDPNAYACSICFELLLDPVVGALRCCSENKVWQPQMPEAVASWAHARSH